MLPSRRRRNSVATSGVKLARTLDEVREYTDKMLGSTLVTHQTGPEGLPVNTVYIEQGSDIDRELYLSMLVDREVSRISFIASAAGGMDIEKVAAETPEKIFSVAIAPDAGLHSTSSRCASSAISSKKCTSCTSNRMQAL
jgi:succinyl-CoA synthetase beta subunit